MKRMKISQLEFDPKLIELRPVNPYFVSRYRQSMRSGAQFPPPIIEDGTNRIVSGNHRITAYLQEFDEDYEIDVAVEKFPDEAAVVRRFAEENSSHGNPLNGIQQKAIVQILLKYGDTPESVASALNIPVKKIMNLGKMSVLVIGKGKKKEMRPVKHGLEHLSGQTMKPKLYDQHRKSDRGVPVGALARQLQRHLENDWIDVEDQGTVDALGNLYAALGKFLDARVAATG